MYRLTFVGTFPPQHRALVSIVHRVDMHNIPLPIATFYTLRLNVLCARSCRLTLLPFSVLSIVICYFAFFKKPEECRQCKEFQETIKNLPLSYGLQLMPTFFHLHRTVKRLRALSLCIWRYIIYCILLLHILRAVL